MKDSPIIFPLVYKEGFIPAAVVARLWYVEHPDLDFDKDLEDHLINGYVCSRPTLFAMVKVIDLDPWNRDLAWFIQIAVGDMLELISVLPYYLPKICFCRHNEHDKKRIYPMDKFLRLAVKLKKMEG